MVSAPERLTLSGSRRTPRARIWIGLLAAALVAPLGPPPAGSGYRRAFAPDTVRAARSNLEAPWSIREPLGVWALLLVLTWFGLAYRSRAMGWWEMPLVLLGAAVALPRIGNAWLSALLLALPLWAQLARLRMPR